MCKNIIHQWNPVDVYFPEKVHPKRSAKKMRSCVLMAAGVLD